MTQPRTEANEQVARIGTLELTHREDQGFASDGSIVEILMHPVERIASSGMRARAERSEFGVSNQRVLPYAHECESVREDGCSEDLAISPCGISSSRPLFVRSQECGDEQRSR